MKQKRDTCYVVGSRGFIGRALMYYQSLRDCYNLQGVELVDYQRCCGHKGKDNPFSLGSIVILSFALIHNRVDGKIVADDAMFDDQRAMYVQYIQWCVEAKVKRVVLVSSTAIYGVFTATGVETSPYARHRLEIEHMLVDTGLNYSIVRPSCVLSAKRESSYKRLNNGVGYVLRHISHDTILDTSFLRCFSLLPDVVSAIFSATRGERITVSDVVTIGPCNIEYVLTQHYHVDINQFSHRGLKNYTFACPPNYYLPVLQAADASGISAIWSRAAKINAYLNARIRPLDDSGICYELFVNI